MSISTGGRITSRYFAATFDISDNGFPLRKNHNIVTPQRILYDIVLWNKYMKNMILNIKSFFERLNS